MRATRTCFFVMPFRPELNFFYLYTKRHLEEKHGLVVHRGDTQLLTKELMLKIREQIERADFIIGDVTGGNPNVFYELGLAHANKKPIIFLTQESPTEAPVDIRQFEFIQYNLGRHEEYMAKLDNAVQNLFAHDYSNLFEHARELLREFNGHTLSAYRAAAAQDFQARVMRGEQAEGIPGELQQALLAEFLLPKIIDDPSDVVVMRKVTEWISTRWHRA